MAITLEQAYALKNTNTPVYFYHEYADMVLAATVTNVDRESESPCVYLKDMTIEGFCCLEIKDVYLDKNEAIDARNRALEAAKDVYRQQIHTVKDLVRFAYEIPQTDLAREVYAEKAKELLGLEL